ncbi:MAG: hypothetical protein AB1696_21910 [Planctomycetota bacterium]
MEKLHDHDEMLYLHRRVLARLRMADGLPEDPFLFDGIAESDGIAHLIVICRKNEFHPDRIFPGERPGTFDPPFVLFGFDSEEDVHRIGAILKNAVAAGLFDVLRMSGRDFQRAPLERGPSLALGDVLKRLRDGKVDVNYDDSEERIARADRMRRSLIAVADPTERDTALAHFMQALYERVKLFIIPSLCSLRSAIRAAQISDACLIPMIEDALEIRRMPHITFLPGSLAHSVNYLYI